MTEALKRLRGKKLLSQEQVAESLSISRQAYNTYENNIEKLSLNQIIDILSSMNATNNEIKEFFDEIQQDILSQKNKNQT